MSVPFGEAVSAIASSLVAARRALDAATADLVEDYRTDERLRGLPVPAFALAEATFEVPYVVEEVVVGQPPDRPPLPPREVIRLGDREVASLIKGVAEDVRERFEQMIARYEKLAEFYQAAAADPAILDREPVPELPALTPKDLEALKTNATATAGRRLDLLLRDAAERHALLRKAAAGEIPPGEPVVLIRMDRAALADVPADRLQRATLTFRDQPAGTVEVEGRPVVAPE
jgi:hypothetical protein